MSKYSKDFFEKLYLEFENSDLTIENFCKLKGIATSTFYKNRKSHLNQGLIDVTNKIREDSSIKINLRTMELLVDKDSDITLLKEIIRGLL